MTCPICHKKSVEVYRPFCSKNCADIDLGRWMTGHYAVPSQDPDQTDEWRLTLSCSEARERLAEQSED